MQEFSDVMLLQPEDVVWVNSPKFLLGMGSAEWNMRFICTKVLLMRFFFTISRYWGMKAPQLWEQAPSHCWSGSRECTFGSTWSNPFPKGKSRVCVAQHSSSHVILGAALHCLSDQAAPPADSHKPRSSSKPHPELFYFYFASIKARHQRKIKVNYCVLWVSETSFCFLPRSCSAPWVGTAGPAPIPSPSHSHSHHCSSQRVHFQGEMINSSHL